ncbi:MAG: antiterminator LoaP [Lachnospiraceae bacterium]|nr:antiterminator LoaP [Lachnospiraceae bacterium]
MWYVVQVMNGHEHKIAELCKTWLLAENEEVFVPMYERKKKIKGNWELKQAILFPGYIFFCTDDIEAVFVQLKDVKQLTKVLRTGEDFTPLHEAEVTFLQQFGRKEHIVEMSVGYIEGDRVVITSGPMMNWDGKVKKIDRHKKIAVLGVEFFGRMTDVTVGLEIVEKK